MRRPQSSANTITDQSWFLLCFWDFNPQPEVVAVSKPFLLELCEILTFKDTVALHKKQQLQDCGLKQTSKEKFSKAKHITSSCISCRESQSDVDTGRTYFLEGTDVDGPNGRSALEAQWYNCIYVMDCVQRRELNTLKHQPTTRWLAAQHALLQADRLLTAFRMMLQ